MIYVLLLQNVMTQKQVYFIGYSEMKLTDVDLMLHFMNTNIMTSTNYYFIQLVQWIVGDENEILEVILEYINKYDLNDSVGKYNILWDKQIVCNEVFYLRIKQIKQLKNNGNPFL